MSLATHDLLCAHLADVGAQWSMGTFGAIAEFSRDRGEAFEFGTCGDRDADATVHTARGGIRVASSPALVLVAYEVPTRSPGGWHHAVALCLTTSACAMAGRKVLTELGPDHESLRVEDRGGVLFDLGLGALQVDVCVRTKDPALLLALRSGAGGSLFDPQNPALAAMLRASPHRVFLTRLGRAEVYQPIPQGGAASPDGPHTHLLPRLLATGRTHAATHPIPDGLVPCAHLYPAHPAKDPLGREIVFDAARHQHFQALLRRFGDRSSILLKEQVLAAVLSAEAPASISVDTRFRRAAIRVALRQMTAQGLGADHVGQWCAMHDRRTEPDEVDEDEHG